MREGRLHFLDVGAVQGLVGELDAEWLLRAAAVLDWDVCLLALVFIELGRGGLLVSARRVAALPPPHTVERHLLRAVAYDLGRRRLELAVPALVLHFHCFK